jgi:putative glutamine amidotransferase
MTQKKSFPTNSFHHQAVKTVKKPLIVSAYAPDGVVEGVEDPTRPFVLGVQFHPEFLNNPEHRKILEGFISAAKTYRATRQHLGYPDS